LPLRGDGKASHVAFDEHASIQRAFSITIDVPPRLGTRIQRTEAGAVELT
jgi:hypothetical protein